MNRTVFVGVCNKQSSKSNNALNSEVLKDISSATIDAIDLEMPTRAVVLTGAGDKIFRCRC